jgi:hypothetical protein
MTPTLVFIRHTEIGGRLYHHGEELVPGSLEDAAIDKMLDQKILVEIPQRRSLYRVFAPFSGAKEHEPLDAEIAEFALPE